MTEQRAAFYSKENISTEAAELSAHESCQEEQIEKEQLEIIRTSAQDICSLPNQEASTSAHEELQDEEAANEGQTSEDLTSLLPLETDPLAESGDVPIEIWLREIAQIEPRKLEVPSAQAQEANIEQILSEIEREPKEPELQDILFTERAIATLKQSIPDANRFVAGSFQSFLPAWKKLLSNSKRASSKKVLKWLEQGFIPKFRGTADADPRKREAVKGMLRRVMTTDQIEAFLSAKQPGSVEFKNHKSLYTHWNFSSKELANLFSFGAASLLPLGAPKPIIVHPFGVAETAGKFRLICDARGLNIFLENFPFKYEKLRDVLAYTKEGFYMIT